MNIHSATRDAEKTVTASSQAKVGSLSNIPPQNTMTATTCCRTGWFGFNAGSALTSTGLASTVVANTQVWQARTRNVHPCTRTLRQAAIEGEIRKHVETITSHALGKQITSHALNKQVCTQACRNKLTSRALGEQVRTHACDIRNIAQPKILPSVCTCLVRNIVESYNGNECNTRSAQNSLPCVFFSVC